MPTDTAMPESAPAPDATWAELPGIAEFTALVGQRFELVPATGHGSLALTTVTPLPYNPAPGVRTEPFALTFMSDGTEVLEQATYVLRNALTGSIAIFIVPSGHDAQGIQYEAIFG